jgi:hypothetical protein
MADKINLALMGGRGGDGGRKHSLSFLEIRKVRKIFGR